MDVFAVDGLPEVTSEHEVASLIEREVTLGSGDVVCISSTIVSKAEDRATDLTRYPPNDRAKKLAAGLGDADPRFVQAVLEESQELLIEQPFLLAVTRFGHVAPNAGIDRSNVPDHDILPLPSDPMDSASRIREELSTDAAVIITDTCGRPFRTGQRGVAIGYAGIPAGRDWRGETDRDGHELTVTVEAVVDELAAAANIVTGEGAGGTPVAVVRNFEFGDHSSSEGLFRDRDSDFIRQALETWSYE